MKKSSNKKKNHILQDFIILCVGLVVAIVLAKTGIIEGFAKDFSVHPIFASLVAGFFFTSVFTVVPATALIIYLSDFVSIPYLIFFGGLGASVADTIIFIFVRDRLMRDVEENGTKFKKFRRTISRSFLSYFAPLIGALVIASPLPDEIGLALMGFSKTNTRIVFVAAFLCNALGIAIISGLTFLFA